MDATRFDGFARRLASSASRRRVLGVLVAGGLGGTLGQLERQETEARCRPRNRKCNGTCCPKGTYCHNPDTHLCVSLRDTCEVGENYCATGADEARCGTSCFCYRTFDKKTRCGNIVSICGVCTGDSQCTALFGRGAFCVKDTEGSAFCAGCDPSEGACAQPCLS